MFLSCICEHHLIFGVCHFWGPYVYTYKITQNHYKWFNGKKSHYRNCVITRPPPSNSNAVYPRLKLFFRSEIFLLVFLIYRVKPLIMFCPENNPLKLKRPNPSETFEMSLRGGSGNYTITVNYVMTHDSLMRDSVFLSWGEGTPFGNSFLSILWHIQLNHLKLWYLIHCFFAFWIKLIKKYKLFCKI